MAERMTGVITAVFPAKGYGFVCDQNGDARFIHASDLIPISTFDKLHKGQHVEFEPSNDGPAEKHGGKRAVRITVLT